MYASHWPNIRQGKYPLKIISIGYLFCFQNPAVRLSSSGVWLTEVIYTAALPIPYPIPSFTFPSQGPSSSLHFRSGKSYISDSLH